MEDLRPGAPTRQRAFPADRSKVLRNVALIHRDRLEKFDDSALAIDQCTDDPQPPRSRELAAEVCRQPEDTASGALSHFLFIQICISMDISHYEWMSSWGLPVVRQKCFTPGPALFAFRTHPKNHQSTIY